MEIEFLDEQAWLNERRSVLFFGKADARLYRCFLEQEALDRHFGGGTAQDYVACFDAHRATILAVAKRLLSSGRSADNRELVLHAEDFGE